MIRNSTTQLWRTMTEWRNLGNRWKLSSLLMSSSSSLHSFCSSSSSNQMPRSLTFLLSCFWSSCSLGLEKYTKFRQLSAIIWLSDPADVKVHEANDKAVDAGRSSDHLTRWKDAYGVEIATIIINTLLAPAIFIFMKKVGSEGSG